MRFHSQKYHTVFLKQRIIHVNCEDLNCAEDCLHPGNGIGSGIGILRSYDLVEISNTA